MAIATAAPEGEDTVAAAATTKAEEAGTAATKDVKVAPLADMAEAKGGIMEGVISLIVKPTIRSLEALCPTLRSTLVEVGIAISSLLRWDS